ASAYDLKALYEDNSDFTLDCDDKILVEIYVQSDCAEGSDKVEIQLDCATYEFEYCSPILNCLQDETEQIMGVNTCIDCETVWSPSQFLILDDILFPTVTAENNANAFYQTYYVTSTSPEGCVFRDTINFVN